jgi:hypothetical protein
MCRLYTLPVCKGTGTTTKKTKKKKKKKKRYFLEEEELLLLFFLNNNLLIPVGSTDKNNKEYRSYGVQRKQKNSKQQYE